MKKQCEELSEKLTNPFLEFYNWITGEIMDVEALQEAIQGRDRTYKTKQNIDSKKRSDTDELNKLNQGKKTLKTLFKSSSGKQAKITDLSNSISQAEKDIEEYDKLIKMIEVHLGETVIPAFKESQMKAYYKICQNIAMLEIDDANKVAKFWSGFLENSNLKSS